MKTITVAELNYHLNDYLLLAEAEEIVIALDDGTLLRLTRIEPEDLADEAFESDPRFLQIINRRRTLYQQRGGVSLDNVKQTLMADLDRAALQARDEAAEYQARPSDSPKANQSGEDSNAQENKQTSTD